MGGRLDSNGVLFDYSVPGMERMAFDAAPRTAPAHRLARRKRVFTVKVDTALRAAAEQRAAADHARECSSFSECPRIVPAPRQAAKTSVGRDPDRVPSDYADAGPLRLTPPCGT